MWYKTHIVVTREQSDALSKSEQGTPEWLAIRRDRFSGTYAANAMGMGYNISENPEKVICEKLWDIKAFQNWFMTHGKENEDEVRKCCEHVIRTMLYPKDKVTFEYPGGIICVDNPWFVCSVDGVARVTPGDGSPEYQILLEFKCPIRELYDDIPLQYYCQTQSYMGFLQSHDPEKYGNLKQCVFGVWTPSKLKFERYCFNEKFFEVLYQRNKDFYFNIMLPLFVLRDSGNLKPNTARLSYKINKRKEEEEDESPFEELASESSKSLFSGATTTAFVRPSGGKPQESTKAVTTYTRPTSAATKSESLNKVFSGTSFSVKKKEVSFSIKRKKL
jgi:hypothetical protein